MHYRRDGVVMRKPMLSSPRLARQFKTSSNRLESARGNGIDAPEGSINFFFFFFFFLWGGGGGGFFFFFKINSRRFPTEY